MKFHCFVLVSLIGVVVKAADGVVQIDSPDEFDAFAEKEATTLVEFYAPWCGHCKKLLPEFEKASKSLAEDGIKLAKVDCTTDDNKPLCSRFDVKGYPTIKFFRNGQDTAYEGGRVAKDIVSFMRARSGPSVKTLETEDAAQEFIKKNGLVVIEFASEPSKTFESSAQGLLDMMTFGSVSDASIAKALEVEMDSIVMFRDFDEPKLVFDSSDDSSKEKFEKWISDGTIPLLAEIGPKNYGDYMRRGVPLLWLAITPGKSDDLLEIVRSLAKDFRDDFSTVYIDGVQYEAHVKNLGLDEHTLPGIIITDENKKYIFDPEKEMTKESLDEFMKAFKKGELTPFLKSAEPPEDNDEPVLVIVGNTFDELVVSAEADVLVEFYAPWCGHCKKLEPEYTDLGERFADNDKIVIAKMDATENDGPVEIKGFPTIFLFSSSEKEPILYQGDRTADEIEKWLLKSAPILQGASGSGHEEL